MPTVSVIIPCFNAEPFVARTLQSLRDQRFEAWECVVVDDGSTDQSAQIAASYAAADPRIRLLRCPNGGVARARNAGYAACASESDYLLFLDADDCLKPEMLQVLVDYLERRPRVCLVYCTFICVDDRDQLLSPGDPRALEIVRYAPGTLGVRRLPADVPATPFVSIFALWAGLLPSNSLLRRSVYDQTPGWDEVMGRPGEDTDVFLQMSLRGEVHYLPRALVRYRRHPGQYSGAGIRPGQERSLYAKWAAGGALTRQHRATVDHARWFREERLGAYLWLKFGASHLRHGTPVEGLKCYARAARQLGMSLRWLRPPRQTGAERREGKPSS